LVKVFGFCDVAAALFLTAKKYSRAKTPRRQEKQSVTAALARGKAIELNLSYFWCEAPTYPAVLGVFASWRETCPWFLASLRLGARIVFVFSSQPPLFPAGR
jgi:hypothetical protein